MLVAYLGHHKRASRCFVSICRDIASLSGHYFSDITSPGVFGKNMQEVVQKRQITFLSCSNARQGKVSVLLDFKGIYLIRDPRDIIVSAYFSHMNSHASRGWMQLNAHRDRLRRFSKEDGLHAEIDFSARNIDSIAEWDYQQPNVHGMKLEAVVGKPLPQILKAYRFIGLMDHEPPGIFPGVMRYYLAGRCSLRARSLLRLQTKRPHKTMNQSDLEWILRRNAIERKTRARMVA